MKIVGARVLVKRDKAEDRTREGLHIPTMATKNPNTGVVVAVGDGYNATNGITIEMSVQVGDRIMFTPHAGIPSEWAGEEHLFISWFDVMAVAHA